MHQPKDIDWLGNENLTCAYMYFHLPHHSVWPSKLYVIILYCRLIMFPLWLAFVITFFFNLALDCENL